MNHLRLKHCSLVIVAIGIAIIDCTGALCHELQSTEDKTINLPLCESVHRQFKFFSSEKTDTRCTNWDFVTSIKEFNEPSWRNLNLSSHRRLLEEFIRSTFYGGYTWRNREDKKKLDKLISKDADAYVKNAGEMRVTTVETKLFEETGEAVISPDKDTITLLQVLSGPLYTQKCTGTPHLAEKSGLVLVKPDLSGLDTETKISPNLESALISYGFFLYKNNPVFVDEGGIYTFSQNKINKICILQSEKS